MSTNAEITGAWEDGETFAQRSGLKNILDQLVPEGLAGVKIAFGRAAFATTGVTKTVACETPQGDAITTIIAAFVNWGSAVADGEDLWIDTTVSAGNATVHRIAGTTSGPTFNYLIIGT